MAARLIDGKQIAHAVRVEVAQQVQAIVAKYGRAPGLAAVLVGEDPASQVYTRNKRNACEAAGMKGELLRLPAETSQAELLAKRLAADGPDILPEPGQGQSLGAGFLCSARLPVWPLRIVAMRAYRCPGRGRQPEHEVTMRASARPRDQGVPPGSSEDPSRTPESFGPAPQRGSERSFRPLFASRWFRRCGPAVSALPASRFVRLLPRRARYAAIRWSRSPHF